MDAKEFNRQYEDMLVEPLRKIGFQRHGKSLSYGDQTVLALFAFSDEVFRLDPEHAFSPLRPTRFSPDS